MKVQICDFEAWPLWFKPISVMQSYLRLISSFYPNIPRAFANGYFGEDTVAAVTAFQQEFNLPVSGNIDFATWSMIVEVWQRLNRLSVGTGEYNLAVPPAEVVLLTQGEADDTLIPMLQTILHGMAERFNNMPPVELSGVYDEATSNAVQAFRRLADLPDGGDYLDRETWNKLVAFWAGLSL